MHGDKENYMYLGILEAGIIKQTEMKEKVRKELLIKARKPLKIRFYRRNLIRGIKIWEALLVRYSGPFLKCTTEEHKQIDQKI